MERVGIRTEERTGLLIAVGLHLALLAALFVQALMPAVEIPRTERMNVSLAEDVGLEATAPEPVAESRAAIAPELSDAPAPAPEMLEAPDTPQVDRPTPRVQPNPAPAPEPAPARETRPQPRREQTREQPREQAQPRRTERSGGSRVGDNFLAGSGDSTTTNETRVPASQIGASAKASLVQRISQEIKPHWQPPSGPEVEQITTYLRFQLNPDGSLAGRPSVVRQTGVNDTNRAQAGRHGEQAIRAVQLAAPFELPEEFYEAWKVVGPFGFDWRLAQ